MTDFRCMLGKCCVSKPKCSQWHMFNLRLCFSGWTNAKNRCIGCCGWANGRLVASEVTANRTISWLQDVQARSFAGRRRLRFIFVCQCFAIPDNWWNSKLEIAGTQQVPLHSGAFPLASWFRIVCPGTIAGRQVLGFYAPPLTFQDLFHAHRNACECERMLLHNTYSAIFVSFVRCMCRPLFRVALYYSVIESTQSIRGCTWIVSSTYFINSQFRLSAPRRVRFVSVRMPIFTWNSICRGCRYVCHCCECAYRGRYIASKYFVFLCVWTHRPGSTWKKCCCSSICVDLINFNEANISHAP